MELSHAQPFDAGHVDARTILERALSTLCGHSNALQQAIGELTPRLSLRFVKSAKFAATARKVQHGVQIEMVHPENLRDLALLGHELGHALHMQHTSYERSSDLWREVVAFLGELTLLDALVSSRQINASQQRGIVAAYNAQYFGPDAHLLRDIAVSGAGWDRRAAYPLARACAMFLYGQSGPRGLLDLCRGTPKPAAWIFEKARSFLNAELSRIHAHLDSDCLAQQHGWRCLQQSIDAPSGTTVAQLVHGTLCDDFRVYRQVADDPRPIAPITPGETYAWRRVVREYADLLPFLAYQDGHNDSDVETTILGVLPPLLFRQIKLWKSQPHLTEAAFSWAWTSPETANEFHSAKVSLRHPQSWQSGSQLVGVDLLTPPGSKRKYLREISRMPLLQNTPTLVFCRRNRKNTLCRLDLSRVQRRKQPEQFCCVA